MNSFDFTAYSTLESVSWLVNIYYLKAVFEMFLKFDARHTFRKGKKKHFSKTIDFKLRIILSTSGSNDVRYRLNQVKIIFQITHSVNKEK